AERTLAALSAMVETLEFRTDRMRELAGANFATATELANWLVRERGLPFRRCHEIVGAIVRDLIAEGGTLQDTARVAALLAKFEVNATPAELSFLEPLCCLERQLSLGSTGPTETSRMRETLVQQLAAWQAQVAERRERITRARAATAQAVQHMLNGGALADLNL
ncbi:MAG: hypothetical protein ACUVX8_07300, partial [Candidatus Zipacnadales bacterium]